MFAFRALAALILFVSLAAVAQAKSNACPPFFLRSEDGAIINPVTGENADKPVHP